MSESSSLDALSCCIPTSPCPVPSQDFNRERQRWEQAIDEGGSVLFHHPDGSPQSITSKGDLPSAADFELNRITPPADQTPVSFVSWCERHRQKLLAGLARCPQVQHQGWYFANAIARAAAGLAIWVDVEAAMAAHELLNTSRTWPSRDVIQTVRLLERWVDWGRKAQKQPATAPSDTDAEFPAATAKIHNRAVDAPASMNSRPGMSDVTKYFLDMIDWHKKHFTIMNEGHPLDVNVVNTAILCWRTFQHTAAEDDRIVQGGFWGPDQLDKWDLVRAKSVKRILERNCAKALPILKTFARKHAINPDGLTMTEGARIVDEIGVALQAALSPESFEMPTDSDSKAKNIDPAEAPADDANADQAPQLGQFDARSNPGTGDRLRLQSAGFVVGMVVAGGSQMIVPVSPDTVRKQVKQLKAMARVLPCLREPNPHPQVHFNATETVRQNTYELKNNLRLQHAVRSAEDESLIVPACNYPQDFITFVCQLVILTNEIDDWLCQTKRKAGFGIRLNELIATAEGFLEMAEEAVADEPGEMAEQTTGAAVTRRTKPSDAVEAPPVHEKGSGDEPLVPLTPEDEQILSALRQAFPTTMTQEDIAENTTLGVRTVRSRLKSLRGSKLVKRPHGARSGELITDFGKKHLKTVVHPAR